MSALKSSGVAWAEEKAVRIAALRTPPPRSRKQVMGWGLARGRRGRAPVLSEARGMAARTPSM
ncbi:MAG: hypothetical protein LC126_08690 [Bryobacterales bacterium]|nr:hypothetical protein [Bryobacterales bacterium]